MIPTTAPPHSRNIGKPDTLEARWVFLRGLVRESAHWDDFPQRFARAVGCARVHLIDLPGNGRHWRLVSPLSLTEAMEFARQEVHGEMSCQEDERPPLFLFAISLGAMVAVEWSSRYPQEIAAAVLVNTSLPGLSPFYQRLSWKSWPPIAGIALERDLARRERRILALTTATRADARLDLVQVRVDAYREHPVRRRNVVRQLWAAARYHPPKEKPPVPILLLNGLADRLADPRCTEAIAKAWGLTPVCHPTAGHDLPLDDPDWTIQVVREWLGQRTPFPYVR